MLDFIEQVMGVAVDTVIHSDLVRMLDSIEQVMGVTVDTVIHSELPCRGENCVGLHFLVRVSNLILINLRSSSPLRTIFSPR